MVGRQTLCLLVSSHPSLVVIKLADVSNELESVYRTKQILNREYLRILLDGVDQLVETFFAPFEFKASSWEKSKC